MFLKKIDGPRVVILPDGSPLSRADLPAARTSRWIAQRKRVVAIAVQAGLVTRQDAMRTYELSDFELDSWCRKFPLQGGKSYATCI